MQGLVILGSARGASPSHRFMRTAFQAQSSLTSFRLFPNVKRPPVSVSIGLRECKCAGTKTSSWSVTILYRFQPKVKLEVPVFFLFGNSASLYRGPSISSWSDELSLTREDGEHCGCCTYLAFMDPVLHSIVAEHGAKLDIPGHCPCCRYLKSKGVHDDIAEARKFRRGNTNQDVTTRRLVGHH